MDFNEQLKHISSYTSKLLRRKFGRGPETCQAFLAGRYLVLYIRGFISPMEEVLLSQGQSVSVDNARSVIVNHLLDELKGVIELTFDVEVEEDYNDWNFPNNSGMIVIKFREEVHKQMVDHKIELEDFEGEISRISNLIQKVPDQIITYPISEKIYIVIRKGILIPIEKALIAKGFQQELKFTKDELEKMYFHRYGKFHDILKRDIADIFIDWNFKEDKSVICFILKP